MVIDLPGWMCSTVSMASTSTIGNKLAFPSCYPLFPFLFFFFPFIFISCRLITSQHCSGFCHTLTWISHAVTFLFCCQHEWISSVVDWQPLLFKLSSSAASDPIEPSQAHSHLLPESPTALAKLPPLIVTDTPFPLPNSCSCHHNSTPYWVPPFCLLKLLVLLTVAVLTNTRGL